MAKFGASFFTSVKYSTRRLRLQGTGSRGMCTKTFRLSLTRSKPTSVWERRQWLILATAFRSMVQGARCNVYYVWYFQAMAFRSMLQEARCNVYYVWCFLKKKKTISSSQGRGLAGSFFFFHFFGESRLGSSTGQWLYLRVRLVVAFSGRWPCMLVSGWLLPGMGRHRFVVDSGSRRMDPRHGHG